MLKKRMDISGNKVSYGFVGRRSIVAKVVMRERGRAADLRTDLFGWGAREDTDFSPPRVAN